MKSDTAPYLFRRKGPMLAPANLAGSEAVQALDNGLVEVRFVKVGANQRRRSLYWCTASTVCELLNDAHGLTLTEQELHDITRTKLAMFDEIRLPSGDTFRRLHSTSNAAMQEPERAAYTTRAIALWEKWTGVDALSLTMMGREAA